MTPVLLHCCCAPCSSAILEWMINNNYSPTLFFCNPNIYPLEEYNIRKNEITRYAERLGLTIIEDDYNHDCWKKQIAGHEDQPERGSRCLLCFKYRMARTVEMAKQLDIHLFATTLASSRWKSLEQISEAAQWAISQNNFNITFWNKNWRKEGLQQRRQELLRKNNFYNQLYCGCEFSMTRLQKN